MPGTIESGECWLDIACSAAAAGGACTSCPVLIPLFTFGQKRSHQLPNEARACTKGNRQAARSEVLKLQRAQRLRGLVAFVNRFRQYVLTDCGFTGCCLSTPGPRSRSSSRLPSTNPNGFRSPSVVQLRGDSS